ncbi:MAG: hypothetical protein A2749_03220 [Parcubacteria group bacterium RIFCSPHIGHO2_01_FULL_45_26]|nr:MAG: hypothetical protein A2749_03220 [Parcubacteria group bacterium RIFCSPHIGHO2_01_FULL_45_26]
MDKDEAQFSELFQPLRRVTPRTSLLSETLLAVPTKQSVAGKRESHFLYVEFAQFALLSGFLIALVLLSPMSRGASMVDEIYAMEIEAEEINQNIDNGQLLAEMDSLEFDVNN